MMSISRSVMLQDSDVEQALEAMRSGHALHDHPLQFFLSVRSRLPSLQLLAPGAALQMAVFDHLAGVIIRRLGEVRGLYHLPAPDPRGLETDILADFKPGNVELEAWSLLYHRYICIDRNYSMQAIAGHVRQDERTLRRRQRLGITRLTHVLADLEQETRQHETQHRMRLALPALHPSDLFGVEPVLARARYVLLEAPPPHHLVLHGPAGIGKTALAQSLAHAMIDTGQFEELVWLDTAPLAAQPSTIILETAVRLGLTLTPEADPGQVLRAYLSTHQVLVVMDASDALLADREQAERLLARLDSACVVLTSRVRGPDYAGLYQITIPELTRDQAFAWLDRLIEQESPHRSDWPERFGDLWAAVGGNPLALRLLLHTSRGLPLPAALTRTRIDDLYREIWAQLSAAEQCILLVMLLFPCGTMPYDHVAQLVEMAKDAIDRALNTLVGAALLVPHREEGNFSYSIQPVTQSFLVEHVKRGLAFPEGEMAQHFLQSVCGQRVAQLVRTPQPSMAVALLSLAHDLEFPQPEQWQWAYDLSSQITQAGLWAAWGKVLLALLPDERSPARLAWLHLMAGAALRWVGQLQEAREHLDQALAYYENTSLERAHTLIELAVVCRYQLHWEQVYEFAQSALEIYTRQRSAAGIERCIHELAQIALDAGEAERALAWISRLEHHTFRTWSVVSQAYLLLGQLEHALHAADQAWALLPVQHPNRGRVAVTLGQIYDALGNSQMAVQYLLTAVEMLDDARDIIGNARACNNLAVAYLKQPVAQRSVPAEAIRRLLMRALRIQEHIGDRIGQAVTRQNLDWLDSSAAEEWPY